MIRMQINGPSQSNLDRLESSLRQRMEEAALVATDRAATIALSRVRAAMSGAKLGRLGNAIGATSDLKQGRGVHRTARGFSASGVLHVKGRNERTLGAIEAYTQGAQIRPRRSAWLWISSADLQRKVAGNFRMSPAQYKAKGFEQKIGPLVSIPGRHAGERLLIVKNVTTRLMGRANPRRLPKSGRVRAGRELQESFVAFVGIKSTSRQARVNLTQIAETVRREIPALIGDALDRSR